jgi:hypothetical protein
VLKAMTATSNAGFALRGLTLRAGALTWRARSLDARLIAGSRWVEIALAGPPDYRVVLKIAPHADVHDTRRALEW